MSASLCLLCALLGSKPVEDNLPQWRNPLATCNILPTNGMAPSFGVVPLCLLNPTKMAFPHLATVFVYYLLKLLGFSDSLDRWRHAGSTVF
jgi:hypothetical protein